MMKRILPLLFCCALLAGCKKESPAPLKKQESRQVGKQATAPKKIGDYLSDEQDYYWYAKQSDSSSYWIRIAFTKEAALYQFHGQCLYWFFTNYYHTGTDKVELLWSYKSDCLLNMDFLEKANGVSRYPKPGEAFCEYSLMNDTILKVKYHFPEWVKAVNRQEKDSIFPGYFYLDTKSGL